MSQFLQLVLSLCLLLPIAIFGEEEQPELFWKGVTGQEHVTKLTVDNLDQFVNKKQDVFIMFYAHWCPASAEAKQEFASVAQELHYIEGVDVSLGALDCNMTVAHLTACRSVNVTKYPKFLYFSDGNLSSPKVYKTSCPRDKDYFYNWIMHTRKDNYCSSASPLGHIHVEKHVLVLLMVFMVSRFVQMCFMIS
ncbi:unnamed protein product [Orchesella dallaii]|uniref:Thioredoxin domain-containing protein n=1 Tax=Orchesella dallaii TaxID=48710 RepID=A0ABP1RWZ6_9HEXA